MGMILGDSIRIQESRCPHCGTKLDGAFGIGNNATPDPGSVSLCAVCVNWAVFDENLKMVKPDAKLLAEIEKDHVCQVARLAAIDVSRNRARKN